jgi:hypothetical protein
MTLFMYSEELSLLNHFKNADRYSLRSKSWETLPEMKYARHSISAVLAGYNIYLFSGGNEYIEIFSILSRTYKEVRFNSSDRESIYGVASMFEDKVYLVTHCYIQVYDLELNKILSKPLEYRNNHVNHGKIVNYNDRIYYYNIDIPALEYIDTSDSTHREESIRLNPACFLYKLKDKARILHRINIKTSSIEALKLDTRKFNHTSICTIDSDRLFIAGFSSPMSAISYIYNTQDNSIDRLPNFNTVRAWIGLIYCEGCVYAFGGKNINILNSAEKFDLQVRK